MSDQQRRPIIMWREELSHNSLDDSEQSMLEDDLGIRLYGLRKPGETVLGQRILYEEDGYADLLLLRRSGTGGLFFALDATLQRIGADESDALHQQVLEIIESIDSRSHRVSSIDPDTAITYTWAVPVSLVSRLKERLAPASVEIFSKQELFKPPTDEELDYAEAAFEPLAIVAGVITTIGFLISSVSEEALDPKHGGAIFDSRSGTIEIRTNPSVPLGTVLIIGDNSVTPISGETPNQIEDRIKQLFAS